MPNFLFEGLPGVSLRVKDVSGFLARMWSAQDEEGPSGEAHASQLNLIIHFGPSVGVEDGLAIFETAVAFSKIYPCRIIILCPVDRIEGPDAMMAKLFSLCYVGGNDRNFCSSEAVILGFLPEDRCYLEDLVFLWLENDLPIYHWFHRVSMDVLERDGLPLLRGCRRVVFSSAIENDAIRTFNWPKPQAVGDLVRSSLLPIRQTLGQFLSAYEPHRLIDHLKNVTVCVPEGYRSHGQCLLDWQKQALSACAKSLNSQDVIEYEVKLHEPLIMQVNWHYQNDYFLKASFHCDASLWGLEANFGGGPIVLSQPLQLLPAEKSLAEALFFST